MKILLYVFIIFAVITSGNKKNFTENEHVKIEAQFPEKLTPSKTGAIVFSFAPNSGIHVNTAPMFELVLDKKSLFETDGIPRFQKNDKGYLAAEKPVEFSVKVKKGTAIGKHHLKGSLRYFFCSDKDGWCNRYSQPFDVTIELTK
ncbi:MAG: hypothetical protein PHP42_04540 [Bacteroidota bacterium]|nr:hypothetical protein [Bacteroidota bacterium]